ncbi:MAG: DUF3088 family protein [Verrucomicrobiota bacterium JB024]|nr:DUF3088 family protein [Verrucomicrobiota bacterium JB024]
MKAHTLFILKPCELNAEKITAYCRDSAQVLGLFQFFPYLKDHVEVRVLNDQEPRTELVRMLGGSNQSCPLLLLNAELSAIPPLVNIMQANGRRFITGTQQISRYLAATYGSAVNQGKSA